MLTILFWFGWIPYYNFDGHGVFLDFHLRSCGSILWEEPGFPLS